MRPRGRGRVAIALAALAIGASSFAFAPQDEEDREVRAFAVPLARHARTLAEDARDHLRAGRWSAAINELQKLVEEGRGDVLPATWRAHPAENSLYPAYPGAAEWARRTLRDLPPNAMALYRERFDEPAGKALADAMARGGRRSLVAVARRWPLARAAESAWWALGDWELERGHPEDALIAWNRARDLRALFGEELPPGGHARLQLAAARLAAPDGGVEPGFREEGPGEQRPGASWDRNSIPTMDADTWSLPLDLTPFDNTPRGDGRYNLHPVLAGDRVLVNTSLRVYAVDAFTGRMLWTQGPPAGWDSITSDEAGYFECIDFDNVSLRPAAKSGVVVAAMQIPYTETPNEDWQDIKITYRIPERRLYAFDLETGEELWNHLPHLVRKGSPFGRTSSSLEIAGDEREFARLMLVAASPVIVGGRVIVPCYRLQGRIDYHVACYDLNTGELLWSTGLISGQRERNMFGRQVIEFVGSPVTVIGDVVVAQTELGAMAALDLLTGEILWESEYDQLPILKNNHYSTRSRMTVWQVAPPHVADGVVVATPSDSQDLLAVELDDGRVLWDVPGPGLPSETGNSRTRNLDYLIGVDSDTVYLSGRKVVAVQKPGGFRTRAAFRARWEEDLYSREATNQLPTPLMAGDSLIVPHRNERIVLDRWTGQRRLALSGTWSSHEFGNAAVGDGVLFTLGRQYLNGFFDWGVLLDRQRALLAAAAEDRRVLLDTSALLVRHARAIYEAGETVHARDIVGEAKDMLAPLVSVEGGLKGATHTGYREAADSMHGLLRLEARIQVDLADPAGALRALAAARPFASTPTALRDTLLQEESILRSGSPHRRIEVLDEMEERCGGLPLPAEILEGGAAWLIGEAILGDEALRGWQDKDTDMALWVMLTRADARARQRDGGRALQDLHAALDQYGELALNESYTVADVLGLRIDRRLELDGRAAYAPFERDATNLFQRAVAENDRRLLEDVVRLFPQSKAAHEANRALLVHAYQGGDAREMARMVYGQAAGRQLSAADRRAGLLQLAMLLAGAGNAEFLTGFVAARRDEMPALRRGLDAEGQQRLTTLLGQAEREPDSPPPLPQFTHRVGFVPLGHLDAQHEYLGAYERAGEGGAPKEQVHVYLRHQRTVVAFASSSPSEAAWTYEAPYGTDGAKCAVGGDRVVIGSNDLLVAIDHEGVLAWSRKLAEDRILGVKEHSGVVVVELGASKRPRLVATFEAHEGTPLWEMPVTVQNPIAWRHPILSGGRAVFFVTPYIGNAQAVVVDVFSGDLVSEFDIGEGYDSKVEESAWIAGEYLVIPGFGSRTNQQSHVAVHELATGHRHWLISFPDGERLQAIAAWDGQNYLITGSDSLGQRPSSAGIHSIDIGLKSRRRIVSLDVGEEVIGLSRERRTELGSPYVFLRPTSHKGNTTPIKAIHLPNGRRWIYPLPVADDELYDSSMSMPVVSESCVAFAYGLINPNTRLPQRALLEFVDLQGGFRLDSRTIIQSLAGAERIELRGLGSALFLLRKEGRTSTRGIDVLVEATKDGR